MNGAASGGCSRIMAEPERLRQSLLADAGRGDLLKRITDRVELRPNSLRMILSLVPVTPASAPPNRLALAQRREIDAVLVTEPVHAPPARPSTGSITNADMSTGIFDFLGKLGPSGAL